MTPEEREGYVDEIAALICKERAAIKADERLTEIFYRGQFLGIWSKVIRLPISGTDALGILFDANAKALGLYQYGRETGEESEP